MYFIKTSTLLASVAVTLLSTYTSPDNSNIPSRVTGLLTLLLLAPFQTAAAPDIVLFDNDDLCDLNGPYEMCRDVPQNACCNGGGRLWTCAYLDADGQEVLHTYSTQFGDHCRIPLESALANICVCPTGTIVISGAKWNFQVNARDGISGSEAAGVDGADESCTKTMAPNAVGVRVNGTRFVVSNTTDPAGFALVIQMMAQRVDKAAITERIVNIGTAE